MPLIDEATIIMRGRTLMQADLSDEIVALDPASSQCYAFNATAAAVWRLVETPVAFGSLVDALCADFAVERQDCAIDVAALIDDLARDGIVERKTVRS